MRAIRAYKLEAKESGDEIIMLPDGAEILHVTENFGVICIFASVDLEAPEAKAYIKVVDTDQEVPEEFFEDLIYLGFVPFLM